MSAARDADREVHAAIGKTMRLGDLARHMIVTSSNLATNLLVDLVGVEPAQQTLARYGISGIELARGVEDGKAFEAAFNNRVTADGLVDLFRVIHEGRAPSADSARQMLEILFAQEFRSGIPAGLPSAVRPQARIANKTGEISVAVHDAGLGAARRLQHALQRVDCGISERGWSSSGCAFPAAHLRIAAAGHASGLEPAIDRRRRSAARRPDRGDCRFHAGLHAHGRHQLPDHRHRPRDGDLAVFRASHVDAKRCADDSGIPADPPHVAQRLARPLRLLSGQSDDERCRCADLGDRWRTSPRESLRRIASQIFSAFRRPIARVADPLSLRLVYAVLAGRAPSLLDVPERPREHEDVGRLCAWQRFYPDALLERSRFERVVIRALSGEKLRLDGFDCTPTGMQGWSRVVFRRDGDGRRVTVPLEDLLAHPHDWGQH